MRDNDEATQPQPLLLADRLDREAREVRSGGWAESLYGLLLEDAATTIRALTDACRNLLDFVRDGRCPEDNPYILIVAARDAIRRAEGLPAITHKINGQAGGREAGCG